MGKRGVRLPYRMVFEYTAPAAGRAAVKGRSAYYEECVADGWARGVARRGGTASVVHVADDGTETILATYTPDDIENDEEA